MRYIQYFTRFLLLSGFAITAAAANGLDCSQEPESHADFFECTKMRTDAQLLQISAQEEKLEKLLTAEQRKAFNTYKKAANQHAVAYCDFEASLYSGTQSTSINLVCLESAAQQHLEEINDLLDVF